MPHTRTITVGSILDERFEVESILGRGGFATVYQARQLNIGRSVALKVLDIRPNKSEEEVERFCERFFQEARNAAGIAHPDIVNVFDHGVTREGLPYIVLELLKGLTLEEELRTYGPMEPTRALPLFMRCLDALQAAHDKRIVHKDLKPSNLFVTNRKSMAETIRILDFGIAALADSDERLTATGQYVGTAAYCAPEYYEHNLVTPALDVYQMGLCLAETLMGSPVVTGPNAIRVIAQHCTGDLKLPWKLLQDPLGPIFKRALALDPEQRFPNAAALRDALATVDPERIEPMSDDDIRKRVALSSLTQPSITEDDFGGADNVLAQFSEDTPNTRPGDTKDSGIRIRNSSPIDVATADTLDTPHPTRRRPVALDTKGAQLNPLDPFEPKETTDSSSVLSPNPAAPPQPSHRSTMTTIAAALLIVGGLATLIAIAIPSTPETEPTATAQPAPKPKTLALGATAQLNPEDTTGSTPSASRPSNTTPQPTTKAAKAPTNTESNPTPKTTEPQHHTVEVVLHVLPRKVMVESTLDQKRKLSRDGKIHWTFDTRRAPWELYLSSPRHDGLYLRFDTHPTNPQQLTVRQGNHDGKRLQWNTSQQLLVADKEGRFDINAKLPPSTPRRRNTAVKGKAKWIVD